MSLHTLERNSPSPNESESEDQSSLSSYEGFICREGCAMSLSPRPGASVGKHGGSLRIMNHLKKLNKIMRPQDAIRLAVELEKSSGRLITRYMIVITSIGVQDTEETIILGTEQQSSDNIQVCLVLPLWRDTEIKLDGDGGFSIHSKDRHHVFKPCSVQSMWTALQYLFKATDLARCHNYYDGGLSHTWTTFYKAQLTEDGVTLNEWSLINDLESFRPDSPIYYDAKGGIDWTQLDSDKKAFKNLIVQNLREVMLHSDLEEVTSLQLRKKVEEVMKMDLKEYKGFLDQQMLMILGQLEKPSQIHEYLYLGSEWNAANLTELKELGIEYIVNITREIDNFYPEIFKYKTVRVYDVPESELLKHWDDTYKFIKEAKESKSKAFVHCKMGISRSAATVIAYTMKEYGMSLEQAKRHVKERRSCINPNHGFLSQLKAYEGILKARYNNLFGSQVPSRITYQTRSSSDPNLRGKVEDDLSSIGGNKDTMEEGAESDETTATQEINEQLMMRVCESLPPEKVEGMQNYLATLEVPQIEEHDDLGINVPSSSESGSPFSSPLFTPPDEDSILSRIFNDNHSSSSNQRRKELGRSMDDNLLHITSSGRCYNMEYDRSTRATSVPLEATNNTCISPVKASIQSPLIQSPSPSNMDTIDYHQPAGTNTVTQRIKQIESLNKPMKQRPHSAGACIKRYDPLPATMETPTSDMFPSNQEVPQQEEPPIILPTTTSVLTQSCDSPTTRYKRAAEQSAILMEQKNISPKVDVSASAEELSSSGKGVKELLDIFDGSSLKRSVSLRGGGGGNVPPHELSPPI